MSARACSTKLHEAMKAAPAVWRELRLLGHTRFPADDGEPAELLEFRDCPCGSTLTKALQPDDLNAALAFASEMTESALPPAA